MKTRKPILELCVTAALALLLGFFLAAGAQLDGGGYLGYGVEHYANDVFINWHESGIYLETLLYTLPLFAVLLLLWRALDWIAARRALRLLDASPKQPSNLACGSGDNNGSSVQAARLISLAKDSVSQTLHLSQKTTKHDKCSCLVLIKKRWFWITVLLLLCCWLPFWLGLWPGIFNYDGHYQYQMIAEGHLQTHHPLLHTFLLDGLMLLGEHVFGSVNTGLALYLGLCLAVCALAFSWMLRTMAEEGARKALLVGSFLFLAVNPALVIWLISTNKDVLFSAFLLLAALTLYRACRFRSWELQAHENIAGTASLDLNARAHSLRLAPAVALALFWLLLAVLCFRTSAIHSFVVFLPFAVFLIRKHLRLRLMVIMVGAAAVFLLLSIVLVAQVFNVPSGPWQALDALTIPRQQLARVWVQTTDPAEIAAFEAVFSKEDLEKLETYEADIADTSRSGFLTAFQKRPLELLDLYINMGVAHPGTYTDAALLTSYEGWYPGAVTDGYVMDIYFAKPGEARSSYIDASTFTPATEAWILGDVGTWLKEFGLGNHGLDLAPVRLLCSPAVYMWILLIVLARTVCIRDRRGALVCTLFLVFGLTALLSPLVVMRYYLMVMVATPLLLHIASSPSWRSVGRE